MTSTQRGGPCLYMYRYVRDIYEQTLKGTYWLEDEWILVLAAYKA